MSGMEPLMLANFGLSVMQQSAQQKKQKSAARAAYEARVQQANAQDATYERQRLKDLERASARQRAMFAAQGVSSMDGSASATLQGMQVDSDAAAAERARQRDWMIGSPPAESGQSFGDTLVTNLLERQSPALSNNLTKLLQW